MDFTDFSSLVYYLLWFLLFGCVVLQLAVVVISVFQVFFLIHLSCILKTRVWYFGQKKYFVDELGGNKVLRITLSIHSDFS